MSDILDSANVNAQNPGAESLIFKPAKVSWVVNTYLTRQSNRSLKWFVYVVLMVCLLFIAWSSLTEKAVVIDTVGSLVSKSPPIPVSTTSSMTVKKIMIRDNQTVKKGDTLIVSTRALLLEDQKKISEMRDKLEKSLNDDKNEKCNDLCAIELRVIGENGFPFINRIESTSELSRNLTVLSRDVKEYMTRRTTLRELPATTASLNFEIKNVRQQMAEIRKRNAQQILALEYEQLYGKSVNYQAQLKEKVSGTKSSVATARNAVESSLQTIHKSLMNYSDDAVIRAPNDGTVSFMDLKGEGQIISPGQTLFYLYTQNSELGVKLKLSDVDISKIKKGMEVKLDINSYPASEYGVQDSKITEIPEKITADNKQETTISFDVFGDLAQQSVQYHGKKLPLRSGVSLRAKIIVRHERLIVYYLKKLLSIKDEYLGDA